MHMHTHTRTHTHAHTHTRTHTHTPPPKLDRTARTKDGLTPLHIAACHLPWSCDTGTKTTSCDLIQMLLQTDVSGVKEQLKAQEPLRNRTALHMACSRANVSAVQELLKHIQGMLSVVTCIALVSLYFQHSVILQSCNEK